MSWRDCLLGDVVTLKRGHDLPKGKRKAGPVPVVSSSGFTGWHDEAKAEPPGVVTGRYGTIGEVFFVEQPYWPLNTALYAIDFHENDPRFVSYFLRNQLKNYQSEKAAVPGVDRNVLHKIEVRCPDLPTQERIASILSAYDDLIENNRRRIALLEQAARLLYREWFVHFRFPGHETAEFVDGLPEGWVTNTLADLAMRVDYGFTASADREIDGPRFLRITDIAGGCIDWSTVPRCSASEKETEKYSLREGDVVVARTGATTGWARRIGKTEEAAVFASYLVRFQFGERYDSTVAGVFMQSEAYKSQIKGKLGGAAQPNASAKVLGSVEVVVPTKPIQEDFRQQVLPGFEQIDCLMNTNNKLAAARDLLLPRLMDGRIPV